MINVSGLYPNQPGLHFDVEYYCTRHIPMVRQLLGPALLKLEVDQGVAGAQPGSLPPYLAVGHLYFESLDAFANAFGQHLPQISADVPNYTNSRSVIQVSEVKI
jgi:uncharacterized protein (TIGR02118 family)